MGCCSMPLFIHNLKLNVPMSQCFESVLTIIATRGPPRGRAADTPLCSLGANYRNNHEELRFATFLLLCSPIDLQVII